MNKSVHFSSQTDNWPTPQDFYDRLNEKFSFTLDPCASKENAKCEKFFTIEDDGLKQCWQGHRVFMNPPYGREIKHWVRKANEEFVKGECLILALLPARTDTQWWWSDVQDVATVSFIKGRLKFGGAKTSAPFPSAIALYWDINNHW